MAFRGSRYVDVRHGAYQTVGLTSSQSHLPPRLQKRPEGISLGPLMVIGGSSSRYGATTTIWFSVPVPAVMIKPPASSAGLNPLAAGGVARRT